MNKELKLLGEWILHKKHEIAKEVQIDRFAEIPLTESQKRELQQFEQQLLDIRADFIGLFGEALINNGTKDDQVISDWGLRIGKFIYDLGTPLDEALKDTSFYRNYIWKAIKDEVYAQNFSIDVVFEALSIIDPLLDKAVYYFSLTYIEAFQETLKNAQIAMLELSVPVVSLEPGIGILPLIGIVDTGRAQLLMDETLKQAEKLKLNHLVLDMSGVMTVDTMVADQLFKVIDSLTLIGVKTIITGIRPDVAQTIVSLGINLSNLIICRDPFQALSAIKGSRN